MRAEEIVKLRQDLDLDPAEFAQLLGTNVAVLERLERGFAIPASFQQGLLLAFGEARDTFTPAVTVQCKALLKSKGSVYVTYALLKGAFEGRWIA